jgi:hypothetical protein
MKGNCLAFDAFGQWFEHEGNNMRWMEKVGGEWRPRLGRPAKMGGRSATYSLFLTFFSTNILFSSTTNTLVHNGGTLATWAGRPATYHGRQATLGTLIKGLAKGNLLLHPTSSQA